MPQYICNNCDKVFTHHAHYVEHLNRKRPCSKKTELNQNKPNCVENVENVENQNQSANQPNFIINSETLNYYLNDNKCVYCKSEFSCKQSVLRHLKDRCKEKKKIENEKNVIFNRLKATEEENIVLKKEMAEIKMLLINNPNNKGTIYNNTDNTNTHNNIHNENNFQQNITLISYGKEDIGQIDPKLIQKSANKVYAAPLYITDALHFNDKFPEYHNIYIPSMKEKYAMKYFDGRWNLVDRDNLIDEIYEDKKILVEENLSKFVENLTENKRRRLEEWIESETNDKAEGTIKIKEEIKLLLYNKRHMAIDRKNQMEDSKRKSRKYCK